MKAKKCLRKPAKWGTKNDQENDRDYLTKKAYKKIIILEFCEKPRTLNEIMEYINASHKPTFRKNYLIPLLKDGKLAMTIPDQPKNRNQKYITKNLNNK